MARVWWAWVCAALLLALTLEAHAQTKRAFVVGVGDYQTLVDLQKTVGDANGYAQVFRDDLSFQVTRVPANPTRAQFNAAFGQFLQSIRPGDEVAFVFSGHGWSDGVENYLALADAPRDASEYELRTETVPLTSQVLGQIKARNPKLTLAIIDACRDNPFDNGTRDGFEKGLVRTEISDGTMVVYAAGQRQKALDRLSSSDSAPYSLFTRTLLPKLKDPARPLMRSIDEVREEVQRLAASVNHQQRPAVYSDVSLDFCFARACSTGGGAPAIDPDTALWVEITSVDGTCAGYERYRQRFPNGKYIAQAGRILARAPCVAQPSTTAASTGIGSGATQGAASAPGSIIRDRLKDGSQGPEMVVLPRGSFLMGSPAGEAGRGNDEGPQRKVTIGYDLAVGKFEVTWAEYDRCVAAKACPAAPDDGFGKGSRPVTNVSWTDAKAYATWLSGETGQAYRLLSEAEWEYAARGVTTADPAPAYPWGPQASHEYANYGKDECCGGLASGRDKWVNTSPAGSFPANAFGLHDMHGNVWEWVEDCYSGSYSAGQPSDGRSFTNCSSSSSRVVRGGGWDSGPLGLRSANRIGLTPELRFNGLGFRLTRVISQ